MAVIIGTVIEMILPDGNCKKYIKVVIGIYIVFTIISPVITKFTGETISVSEVLELEKYVQEAEKSANVGNSINSDNQSNIMSMYVSGLKEDVMARLKEKGYSASNIEIGITDIESYTINSISLQVVKIENEKKDKLQTKQEVDKVEKVEKVNVNLDKNKQADEDGNIVNSQDENYEGNVSDKEKKEIKKYLCSVYEVRENNVIVN